MTFLRLGHFASAVLLVGMTVLAVVNAQCTTTTCPPGPVYALFQSADCSGNAEFYPLNFEDPSIPFNACVQKGGAYVSNNITDLGFYEYSGDSSTCSTASDVVFNLRFYPYSVCMPMDNGKRSHTQARATTSTYMIVRNVNATHSTQSTAVDLSYPDVQAIRHSLSCNGPNDCERPDSIVNFWTTSPAFSNPGGCTPGSSQAEYNVSYDGTCYRSGDLNYVTYQCIDESTTLVSQYIGQGCQTLYESTISRSFCTASNPVAYNCSATPVTPPVTAPGVAPGSAPSSTPGSAPSTPTASPQTPSAQTPSQTTPTPSSETTTLLPSLLFILVAIIATFI